MGKPIGKIESFRMLLFMHPSISAVFPQEGGNSPECSFQFQLSFLSDGLDACLPKYLFG